MYLEQQADCFAGAFLDHVAENGNALDVEAGRSRSVARGDAAAARRPGPVGRRSLGARQRVRPHRRVPRRLRIGRRAVRDLLRCNRRSSWSSRSPVARRTRSGGQTAAEDVIPLTVDLLNDFYSQVEPSYVPLSTDDFISFDSSKRRTIPKCGGTTLAREEVENRVFYCLDDGYIGFDEPFLQSVYDEIGDFGVASLIANAWAHVRPDHPGDPRRRRQRSRGRVPDRLLQRRLDRGPVQRRAGGRAHCRPATSTSSSRPSWCTAVRVASSRTCRSRSCGWRSSARASSSGYDSCNYDDIVDATADLK